MNPRAWYRRQPVRRKIFIPFFAITLLAGLQTISPELHEAAAIDGARLDVSYEVTNEGDEDMPFFIGGHPGFACPLDEGHLGTELRGGERRFVSPGAAAEDGDGRGMDEARRHWSILSGAHGRIRPRGATSGRGRV